MTVEEENYSLTRFLTQLDGRFDVDGQPIETFKILDSLLDLVFPRRNILSNIIIRLISD